jgi:hypothetical protein
MALCAVHECREQKGREQNNPNAIMSNMHEEGRSMRLICPQDQHANMDADAR